MSGYSGQGGLQTAWPWSMSGSCFCLVSEPPIYSLHSEGFRTIAAGGFCYGLANRGRPGGYDRETVV